MDWVPRYCHRPSLRREGFTLCCGARRRGVLPCGCCTIRKAGAVTPWSNWRRVLTVAAAGIWRNCWVMTIEELGRQRSTNWPCGVRPVFSSMPRWTATLPGWRAFTGLWGLTQLKRWEEDIAGRLAESSDEELMAQLARYIGDTGSLDASGLAGSNGRPGCSGITPPGVKMMAAIACGKLRSRTATDGLVAMIQDASNAIPVLREAGVTGLMGAAAPAEIAGLSAHLSEAVRIAAVVALRRLQATPELMGFLNDPSPQVMSDAALAIYDVADAATFAIIHQPSKRWPQNCGRTARTRSMSGRWRQTGGGPAKPCSG